MTDCVFCAIVAGLADAYVIHQDSETIAFLPLVPELNGHTLIAPKAHWADLYDMPPQTLDAAARMAQTLARHYRERIGATGANLLHASGADGEQSVFHFHFHLLPRFKGDALHTWPKLPGATWPREDMHARLRIG